MSESPQHWIATDAGSARDGNEDAFLYLGPDETDGGGLWLVVDGEGGPGVGDLASSMLVVTVGELYPELLDAHGDPAYALEVAAKEAESRLATIAGIYPELEGVRASFAAVALHQGMLYPVSSGSCAVVKIANGGGELLAEPEVAHSLRGTGDYDLVPASGIRAEGGPVLNRVSEPVAAEAVSFFLCTDGVSEMVPAAMVAQGVERLAAQDAVEALIELSRRRWSDDDATAAVVRFADPKFQMFTTPDAFLDWAESGMTKWPEKTLMLQAGSRVEQGTPPRSNVDGLPSIGGGEAPAEQADMDALESTMSFSPDQVQAIVAASMDGAGTLPERTAPEGTMVFSPGDAAAVAAAASAGDVSTTGDGPAPNAPTEADPPEQAADAVEGGPAGGPTASTGTMFFSPQEMDRIREVADQQASAASGGAVPESTDGATVGAVVPSAAESGADGATIGAVAPVAAAVASGEPPVTQPEAGNVPPTRDMPAVWKDRTADLDASVARDEEASTVQRTKLESGKKSNAAIIGVLLFVVAAIAAVILWFAIR